MTKRDIAFLKRMIGKTESTPITKIASCYVDISRDDIRFQDTQSFFPWMSRNLAIIVIS